MQTHPPRPLSRHGDATAQQQHRLFNVGDEPNNGGSRSLWLDCRSDGFGRDRSSDPPTQRIRPLCVCRSACRQTRQQPLKVACLTRLAGDASVRLTAKHGWLGAASDADNVSLSRYILRKGLSRFPKIRHRRQSMPQQRKRVHVH